MSATNPSDPYSSAPSPAHRSKWLWAVIAVVVIAVLAVVAYMLVSGGGGYGGGGGGNGGAGGGYALVPFSVETIRRIARRLKR